MGADTRWVCHDCKTVCDRGGDPIMIRPDGITMLDWQHIRETMSRLESLMLDLSLSDDTMRDMFIRWDRYMNDLRKWLSRHDGHNVHIGSDYTTDVMDLGDYFNETVEGAKSDTTRLELASRSADGWRSAGIDKVKSIILAHKSKGAYGIVIDVDGAAEELYNRFCEDIAIERGG